MGAFRDCRKNLQILIVNGVLLTFIIFSLTSFHEKPEVILSNEIDTETKNRTKCNKSFPMS